jgi:hypothetical protein
VRPAVVNNTFLLSHFVTLVRPIASTFGSISKSVGMPTTRNFRTVFLMIRTNLTKILQSNSCTYDSIWIKTLHVNESTNGSEGEGRVVAEVVYRMANVNTLNIRQNLEKQI